MTHPVERILWAMDPFSEKALQIKTLEAIHQFAQNTEAVIEPVTVLSPDQMRLPIQAFRSEAANFRLKAEEILNDWLSGIKEDNLLPFTLLVSEKYSIKSSTDMLTSYAKDSGASLIAVSTHARKGIARLIAGSFAETLLLRATLPLLVINPSVKLEPITKILFPTDMSGASKIAFDQLVLVARKLGADIILYHKVEYVIPDTYSVFTHHKLYEDYMDKDLENREEHLKGWIRAANQKFVKAELIFDREPSFVTQGVMEAVKKTGAQLIALCSHTGPVSAIMLGSVSRQILREAQCPVWTLHVDARESEAEVMEETTQMPPSNLSRKSQYDPGYRKVY